MLEEKYKLLINKYLAGSLEPPEVEELTRWLKEDSRNRSVLEEMKRDWFPESGSDESLEQATRELRYKMNMNISLEKKFNKAFKPTRRLFINAMKIAAIFICGILFTQLIHTLVISPRHSETAFCAINADRGQKTRMSLPDGTEVWLNSESTVRFSTDGFLGKRFVELNGEAYFKVKRNEKVPFVVKTKDYDVKVLGTEFNVMAYEDIGRTETILVKGKVKIKKGEKEIDLIPGQKAIYEANKLLVEKADIEQAKSWKNNELRFNAVTFQELVLSLERWFDVQIEVSDSRLYDVVYSGAFKNDESIEQVLEALKVTTSINYNFTDFKNVEITYKQ